MKLFTGALVLCLLQVYGVQSGPPGGSRGSINGRLARQPCKLTDNASRKAAIPLIGASSADRKAFVEAIANLIGDSTIPTTYGDDLFQLICDMSQGDFDLGDNTILDILKTSECEVKADTVSTSAVASYCKSNGKCYIQLVIAERKGKDVDGICDANLDPGVIAWDASGVPASCTMPFSDTTSWTQRIAATGDCNYVSIDSMGVQGAIGTIDCGTNEEVGGNGLQIICDYPLGG